MIQLRLVDELSGEAFLAKDPKFNLNKRDKYEDGSVNLTYYVRLS